MCSTYTVYTCTGIAILIRTRVHSVYSSTVLEYRYVPVLQYCNTCTCTCTGGIHVYRIPWYCNINIHQLRSQGSCEYWYAIIPTVGNNRNAGQPSMQPLWATTLHAHAHAHACMHWDGVAWVGTAISSTRVPGWELRGNVPAVQVTQHATQPWPSKTAVVRMGEFQQHKLDQVGSQKHPAGTSRVSQALKVCFGVGTCTSCSGFDNTYWVSTRRHDVRHAKNSARACLFPALCRNPVPVPSTSSNSKFVN